MMFGKINQNKAVIYSDIYFITTKCTHKYKSCLSEIKVVDFRLILWDLFLYTALLSLHLLLSIDLLSSIDWFTILNCYQILVYMTYFLIFWPNAPTYAHNWPLSRHCPVIRYLLLIRYQSVVRYLCWTVIKYWPILRYWLDIEY